MNEGTRRLVPLSDAPEYAVNSAVPDVRGWRALSADGENVGEVRELIVDRLAGRVRYLELELAPGFAGRPGQRIIVPVGLTTLEPDEDAVRVLTVTAGSMREVEGYDGGELSRAYEVRLRRGVLGGRALPAELAEDGSAAGAERDDAERDDAERDDAERDDADHFYEHEHFDERRMLAGRRSGETEQDFSYLLGVGGAMTERDVNPEVVGEVRAGQMHIPVVQEETRRSVAPEE